VASELTVLALIIETLVVRHYGLATVFITPLAILLTEAAHGVAMAPYSLMQARLSAAPTHVRYRNQSAIQDPPPRLIFSGSAFREAMLDLHSGQ